MANTNLTVDQITNHALMVLHQKLNFIGSINRQYDDSYKNSGAKNGDSIRIKLPNQFTVRSGKTLNVQDVTQSSVTLQVATQKGVDMNFSMKELTQDITLFSENYIEPAMSVLAANIESDAMSMYKDVSQEVSDVGATASLALILKMNKELTNSLVPYGQRCLNLDPTANVDLISALSGFYNPSGNIDKQYKEGLVANQFAGFKEVYENTLWPIHTTGTDDGTGDYLVNMAAGVTEGATTVTVDTGAGTWKKGDIFYFDGINSVHPETKVSTGVPKRFVITADAGASATSLSFSPAIYAAGAKQNVVSLPANNVALYKREIDGSTAIGNAADYRVCMGYHKDAFAFATADLEKPEGVHFAARKVLDGISMRIVRAYDINNDNMPCRIDVLYGYKTIREGLACRGGFN